jgi:hypothetical protein
MCRRDLATLAFITKVAPEGGGVARTLWMEAPADVPVSRSMF